MSPQLSQQELSDYYNSGETMIICYRRIYEIKYSHGANCYIMQQVYRTYSGQPYIGRGRFIANTPDYVNKLVTM